MPNYRYRGPPIEGRYSLLFPKSDLDEIVVRSIAESLEVDFNELVNLVRFVQVPTPSKREFNRRLRRLQKEYRVLREGVIYGGEEQGIILYEYGLYRPNR